MPAQVSSRLVCAYKSFLLTPTPSADIYCEPAPSRLRNRRADPSPSALSQGSAMTRMSACPRVNTLTKAASARRSLSPSPWEAIRSVLVALPLRPPREADTFPTPRFVSYHAASASDPSTRPRRAWACFNRERMYVHRRGAFDLSADGFHPQWDVYDYVIYAAGQYGLRVILPLTDDYDYYHGGKYTFLRWLGLNTGNWGTLFYSNAQAIAAYKVRFRPRTRCTSAMLTCALVHSNTSTFVSGARFDRCARRPS